jgi:hypothetical protein
MIPALLTMTSSIALCSFGQQTGNPAKKPWEWTLDERIAERCSRSAAQARVERARAQGLAPTIMNGSHREWHKVADVIIGRQSPHLLMPTELFESIVRNGFVLTGWREAFAEHMVQSGLPSTFWEQLEPVSTTYIEDLREQLHIAQMEDKAAAYALSQSMEPRLCADRADALTKARMLFGPALDRFMYLHVAPTKSIDIGDFENPAALMRREQGYRPILSVRIATATSGGAKP